jgi:hypothetical protein
MEAQVLLLLNNNKIHRSSVHRDSYQTVYPLEDVLLFLSLTVMKIS